MADDNKDSSDIYSLRDPSTLTEAVVVPPANSEIFALKESIIGVTLGAGISLCNAYRLDKRLSQNYMGETWKASDLRESRNVDVYLPPLEIRQDAKMVESLQHTARQIEALEHPRIVPVLNSFTDPEHGFFLVRKFVSGKTLDSYRKDYIKRHKKLTPAKTLKILNDIAHALDYAHSIEIIHCNLCPKNIIIGLDDDVNIANFSLIHAQTYDSAGDQSYLAPEIVDGSSATTASDVYALAVIAYELLSGRLPFSPETKDDRPIPIPGVPSSVDAVIQKALVKDPDDRYSSCGVFVKALEAGFQQSIKDKSVIITPYSSPSGKKVHSAIIFGTALVVVLCITGIAIWKMPSNRQIAEQPKNNEDALLPPSSETRVNPQPPISPAPPKPAQPSPSEMDTTLPPAKIVPLAPKKPLTEPSLESGLPPLQDNPPQEPSEESVDKTSDEQALQTDDSVTAAPSAVDPLEPPKESEPNPAFEVPQQDRILLGEGSAAPANFAADALLEEGTPLEIAIDGIAYHFRWVKEPYPSETAGFWIQTMPVTQEMWRKKMETEDIRRWDPLDDKKPIDRVSWKSCWKFIGELNTMKDMMKVNNLENKEFSLPTQEQWDRANPDSTVFEWYDDKKKRSILDQNRSVIDKDGVIDRDHSGGTNIGFRLVIVPEKVENTENNSAFL